MYGNNYYNPYGNQLQQYQQQYQQPSQDERIFVQGEDAAKAYLVVANGFVRLWDSTRPVFYEKRADQTGRPYMESFEYKKIIQEEKPAPVDEGIKNELEEIKKRLEALEVSANEQ